MVQMPEIKIKIVNLPQIKAAFGASKLLMTKELNKAIGLSVFRISADSRRGTPVDTGRLRSSTYERLSNLRGEVGTMTNYDIFVHEGTRYFRGRPYLRKSVESNQGNVEGYFETAVQNVLDKIGKAT